MVDLYHRGIKKKCNDDTARQILFMLGIYIKAHLCAIRRSRRVLD
jgi:hypothetical protein